MANQRRECEWDGWKGAGGSEGDRVYGWQHWIGPEKAEWST